MGRLLERFAPLVTGLAATVGAYFYLKGLPQADAAKVFGTFTSAGITITTTLLGFLLTVYTLFQTVNTRRKQFLVQFGQLPRLNNYLRWSVWLLLVAALLLLTFSLIPTESKQPSPYWFSLQIITIGITALSMTYSVRFVNIYLRLIVDDSED